MKFLLLVGKVQQEASVTTSTSLALVLSALVKPKLFFQCLSSSRGEVNKLRATTTTQVNIQR